MTNEFRELTSRLAKGLNFPENSVCLITKLKDEEYGNVRAKGNAIDLTKGICTAIDRILSEASEADAFECRHMIRQSMRNGGFKMLFSKMKARWNHESGTA